MPTPTRKSSPETDDSGMQRKGVTYEHLAGMIDCLLVELGRLPADVTIEEACGAVIGAVADRLLSTRVGATIFDGHGVKLAVTSASRESSTQAAAPRDASDASAAESSPDEPPRMFPELAFERVTPINDGHGSTLHVASDDEAELQELEVLVNRLALALLGAIHRGRASERVKSQAAELAAIRAELAHSNKLASLGQLAAGIVHELNNPLTSIIAYADYLSKKAKKGGSDPSDIERIARIEEAAARILRFARDLTDYARPSSDESAALALHEIVDRALLFCDHVLDDSSVVVERAFAAVPWVRGVASQLTQVFVNLFTNAAHAMQTNGGRLHVAIASAPSGGHVEVRVVDEGHGIDDAHLDRIFEPFFTTKPSGEGTGLGLSIVRDIVVRHGGTIRAQSRVGEGSTFTILLPALDPEPTEAPLDPGSS